MKSLQESPDISARLVKGADIRSGVLRDVRVVVFPGGDDAKQSRSLGTEGTEAVREFVANGGGFLGFCAGSYLASCVSTDYLRVVDAMVLDLAHCLRGSGTVTINLLGDGQKILGGQTGLTSIYYCNGPLLGPFKDSEIPDYTVLATFESEIRKNGAPEGVMRGTPAIVSGSFGKGRVVCFSPHPEYTRNLHSFVVKAAQWTAQ